MRMELALSDEQAVRLSRCKRLAGVPVARRSARGDFYDTADGQAAQAGLTLEKRGRAWRIGQRSTSAPPWLPIEPTPPVSRLPFEPTGPLGVVASWRGRDAVFSVGSVTLTVRRGSVDGRSIARALFDGPDADVLSLLLDLAEDCAFAIPTLSWANEIWGDGSLAAPTLGSQIGRASCRERV